MWRRIPAGMTWVGAGLKPAPNRLEVDILVDPDVSEGEAAEG